METQYFLKHGELELFSEQAISDCIDDKSVTACTYSCVINFMNSSGVPFTIKYHSTSCSDTCHYNGDGAAVKEVINTITEPGNESQLEASLLHGTIGVEIEVTSDIMLYSSAIFNDETCGKEYVNYAGLVVGYTTENDTDYWILKNNLGKQWGECGYIRLSRNKDNQCRIADVGYLLVLE